MEDWTIEEILDLVATLDLTALLRFEPSGIELLAENGRFVASRGGIKLSKVLLAEQIINQKELGEAEFLAPTVLEGLLKLGVFEGQVRHALRLQLVNNICTLMTDKCGRFSIFTATFPHMNCGADLSLSEVLLEVQKIQDRQMDQLLSEPMLIDQAPNELEMVF